MKLKDAKAKVLRDGFNICTNLEYHSDTDYISSSGLKLLLDDEDAFYRKYVLKEKSESTSFFDFGTYIHALVLEPETVEDDFLICPINSRYGKLYETFKLQAKEENKIIILEKERKQAEGMLKEFNKCIHSKKIMQDGVAEQTYCYTGTLFSSKVRADFLGSNFIMDVKTTSAPLTKDSLQGVIKKYKYNLSAALYMDVMNKFLDGAVEKFYFIFLNKLTNEIQVVQLSEELLNEGRLLVSKAVEKFHKLKEDGFFEVDKQREVMVI